MIAERLEAAQDIAVARDEAATALLDVAQRTKPVVFEVKEPFRVIERLLSPRRDDRLYAGEGHPADLALSASLLANLNSLIVDYCARTKIGGVHLTYAYLKQLPVLPPAAYSKRDVSFIVPRVLELTYTSHSMVPFARDLGYDGPPFAWNEDRRTLLRAELPILSAFRKMDRRAAGLVDHDHLAVDYRLVDIEQPAT